MSDPAAPRHRPRLRHYPEILPVLLFIGLLRLFPIETGSNLAAAAGRFLGPKLRASRRVRDNLGLVWPEMPKIEQERLIRDFWENLFRVGAEYAVLDRIRDAAADRIEIVGGAHLDRLRESGRPAIFFGAHMGNWEAIPIAARHHGLPVTFLYRRFNNPLFNRLAMLLERVNPSERIYKGREGAARLMKVLKSGGCVLMLVDVRMNEGIPVPFLGVEAMTATAPALLAMRNDALLVPVRVERTGPARFRVTVEEPRPPVRADDRHADAQATMTWINGRIGDWVSDRPEQWMWLHRRWGKNPSRPS